MSRSLRFAASAVALALMLAGCGSGPKATGLPTSPSPIPESLTVVTVIDSAFEPDTLTVKPGDEVTWKFKGAAPHNVKFVKLAVASHAKCQPSGTGCSAPGDEYKHVFKDAGEYLYYCVVHGTPAGQGMAGHLVVKA